MKNVKKMFVVFGVVSVLLICMPFNNVNAVLQANKNTQYTQIKAPNSWIGEIRKMEQINGTLGLKENLKEDLTSSTRSNNIDVHMVKSTEYGAMAILSASSYGNPSNAQAITTSTGNNSGVIMNTSYWENVAGGVQGVAFSGVHKKYFDGYVSKDSSSAKVGDALTGTSRWHSAAVQEWVNSSTEEYYGGTYCYLVRGKGGIFAYRPGEPYGIAGTDFSHRNSTQYSRAVIVCGEGI